MHLQYVHAGNMLPTKVPEGFLQNVSLFEHYTVFVVSMCRKFSHNMQENFLHMSAHYDPIKMILGTRLLYIFLIGQNEIIKDIILCNFRCTRYAYLFSLYLLIVNFVEIYSLGVGCTNLYRYALGQKKVVDTYFYLITYATLQSYSDETMTTCVRHYPNSKWFMHMHAKL